MGSLWVGKAVQGLCSGNFSVQCVQTVGSVYVGIGFGGLGCRSLGFGAFRSLGLVKGGYRT